MSLGSHEHQLLCSLYGKLLRKERLRAWMAERGMSFAAQGGGRRKESFEPLERRGLMAAVNWTGGGDGVTWTDARNWSSNPVLPGAADDVVISLPAANPTISLSSGTQSIHSLLSDEAMNLTGGTLSVAAASQIGRENA